jgi:tetratricopeptide (TPR) repeat protein
MLVPMRNLLAFAAVAVLSGCAEPAAPPPAAPARPATTPPAESAPLRFIEDDLAAATAKARAEGKALFVDAWAPWCHTCLSMKNFVFGDPSFRPLGERVVFASIDTDRPEAAAFLAKYTVKAWPTFFVIDPATGAVVGHWEGSGSLREMRGFIDESLAVWRGTATDPASKAYAEARAAHAAGKLDQAAAAYERAVKAAPPTWPSRSAALLGWIEALSGAKAWPACVQVGRAHLGEVQGSSAPSDFSGTLLNCAEKLGEGPDQTAARTAAVARLRDFTAHPPADASVDDRQDAFGLLAEALEEMGDGAGAHKAQEDRLALLEQAAKAAKTPELAHTFDYARANTYLALGRIDEAVRMLEQRERELPDAYEPPARLAGVLYKAMRYPEALAAVKRAIQRSYGPRKLRYLQLEADILTKMGDTAGALAAVREEAKGWEALPPGQASPERLADAKRRLAAAEQAAKK